MADATLKTVKDGVTYDCARFVKYLSRGDLKFWRCGCCKRGRLQSWDKECKVCHAKVVKS